MAFPQNFLEEIKNRIAVSDIVGRKVKLVRRGREFVGLSPFKSERTPSFTVNDDKQFYHCFATGKHGSVFDFVMETEGLSFPEAVERLAQQAGLPMPERDPRAAERAAKQASLVDVTEAAANWFQQQLQAPQAADARDYLTRRGVTPELMKRFGIGFAPSARTALADFLTARNIKPAQLVETGLAIQPDEKARAPYDRFRDRIIFPIHDARGRVIAFGGRAMQADAPAKYLNSPETPLFHKGAVLFNFARARQAAYDAGSVLVAEGYMDVVGLARAGFDHAVAPLGTAITPEQLRLLWRLAPEPVMCLDGDAAGLRAAYRAIDRALPLLKPGFSLRFALLPAGKDPDDVVAEGGQAAMQAVIDKAMGLSDLLWERELEAAPWDTPERAAALKQRLREAVATISDADVRGLYGQDIRARLDRLLGATGQASDGRQNYGQGRRMPSRRGGRASAQARRSALATGSAEWSHREAVIVLCVYHHPALLGQQRDAFEALELQTQSLDRLRYDIIDWFDENSASEAAANQAENATGLDNSALKLHLKDRGVGDIAARLEAMPEARLLSFVRLDSELEQVIPGWLEVVRIHHKLHTLMAEKKAVEADLETELERDGTQYALDRLIAIQNEIAALENQASKSNRTS